MSTFDFDEVEPRVGLSVNAARDEVNDALRDMEMFHQMEPDEITRRVIGHSARLTTIRVLVMRIEDYQRQWKDLRLRELEPVLEQLRDQFSMASRLHSYREFDWRIETGER